MALLDILGEDLTENNVRVFVQKVYELDIKQELQVLKSRTPKPAKSLIGTYTLVKDILDNIQTRAGTSDSDKVLLTEEEPDATAMNEIITFSVVNRVPGSFSQGAPHEGKIRNQRPIFREEIDDQENPGYRLITTGYWHDNVVRFTCWARTNKAANNRAEWLEGVFEEYAWYLKAEGVDRFLFERRGSDITADIRGNKWYGRPLDYFVRTETLRVFSEKKIEEILLKVAVKQE